MRDLDIKGSCLGCLQCGYDNQCVYQDKDGYIDFYNTKLETAASLMDRSVGSLMGTVRRQCRGGVGEGGFELILNLDGNHNWQVTSL